MCFIAPFVKQEYGSDLVTAKLKRRDFYPLLRVTTMISSERNRHVTLWLLAGLQARVSL